ncbi:MAG: fibronectin type III domain-containing protein, partial [Bacteroidia bacterium]|nr:fibronectin type III domain-containing protein [Bacteroidia bacterium]
ATNIPNPIASPWVTTTYTVTASHGPGCTASATVTITVASPPIVLLLATSPTCGGCSDGVLLVSGWGGTPPYEYSLDGTNYQSVGYFSGLTANTYTAYVRGANGCVNQRTINLGTCVVPSGLSVPTITSTTANIQWNVVSGAASYNLRYRRQTSTAWTSVFTSNNSYALTNLTPQTAYVVQVRTACGQSVYSAYSTQTFTTAGASTANCVNPSPVTVMPAISSALVTWPSVQGATMYQVSFRRNVPGTPWTTVNRPPNTPNYLMTGLLPATEYEVMVRSVCGSIRVPYPPSQLFTTQPMNRDAEPTNDRLLLTVYPNPTHGSFTVYVAGLAEGSLRFSLYDALGRKVYSETHLVAMDETALSVDVTQSLAKGVYTLTVESGKARQTTRLVIE